MADPAISENAARFRSDLAGVITSNIAAHKPAQITKIDLCYANLTALQAIRMHLLHDANEAAIGFYNEAQSDGLTSQALILTGMGRSALKSLRSLIENCVRSVYYSDHPIEYRLWETENHRPTFSSFFEYLQLHPDLKDTDLGKECVKNLKSSWKSLSNAVHASVKSIRTTETSQDILLWKTDAVSVGRWVKCQNSVISDICIMYICLYRGRLEGAKAIPLRKAFGEALKASLDTKIKAQLGVKVLR